MGNIFDWTAVLHHNGIIPAFFLQIGYMNDGTILAADITYYSNGGCTLDESSFVCWFFRNLTFINW